MTKKTFTHYAEKSGYLNIISSGVRQNALTILFTAIIMTELDTSLRIFRRWKLMISQEGKLSCGGWWLE